MLPFARPGESVVAVVALLLIVVMCRWVFSPSHTPVHAVRPTDYGLLVPVASSSTDADAAMLRDVLVAEGIRACVGAGHEVLVFSEDLDRARALVG